MNNNDSLDQLSSFYKALDKIPTPPLILEPPSSWGRFVLVLAPLGASVLAYGFIACCAYGPVKAGPSTSVPSPFDRLAQEEMSSDAPVKPVHKNAPIGLSPKAESQLAGVRAV